MDWILEILKEAIRNKFTGQIQINIANGGVSNVNRRPAGDTLKPPK